MAIERKIFSGILNTDDNPAQVLPAQHVRATNLRYYGGNNGLIAENIKGNYLIPNSNLPAGTNEGNGAFYDSVNRRILWFNWNQYGNNGIYSYSVQTGVVTQIFRCGVNSATNILGLSPNYPVASAAIVYRTTGDGDLLYWTDGTNRPMYLNLDTVATLSPFTSDMINAAKNAPGTPPTAAYGNDATINSNSLKKKLFRFCYRWVYKNLEKSTFSPISAEPLPIDEDNPTIANDPTKNNKITLTIYTGGRDFQSVELAVQESLGTTWSDFKTVSTFDRDDYNLTVNSTFTFDFYNNGGYNPISVEDHAIFHSVLYRMYGKQEDYIAWKCLEGSISNQEARVMASRLKVATPIIVNSIEFESVAAAQRYFNLSYKRIKKAVKENRNPVVRAKANSFEVIIKYP